MSNPIDGGAGPGGPDWAEATSASEGVGVEGAAGEPAGVELAGFDDLGAETVDLEDLNAVINEVAERLQAGELRDPVEAIERVIDEAVALRTEGFGAGLQRDMAASMRAVLMDDPFFVVEVEALIAHALARLS